MQGQDFYEWLEKTGHQAVAEKIRKVNVPYTAKNIHGGGNVIEQLQWSEFGDLSEDGRKSWMSSKCLECVL